MPKDYGLKVGTTIQETYVGAVTPSSSAIFHPVVRSSLIHIGNGPGSRLW